MHERAIVALGSNVGDRVAAMRAAVSAIRALPGVRRVQVSGLYETPAVTLEGVGKLGDPDTFLNAAVMFETDAMPTGLLDALLELERMLGRLPRAQRETWGPRPIDLDLLWMNDRHVDQPGLKLPHPRITQRWFVLAPLVDLFPDLSLSSGERNTAPRTVREWLAAIRAEGEKSAGVGEPYADASWASG